MRFIASRLGDGTIASTLDTKRTMKDGWKRIRCYLEKFPNGTIKTLKDFVKPIDTIEELEGDDRLFEQRPYQPFVTHVCFLCGTAGATMERIKFAEFKKCLLHIRKQRVPEEGWISRECRRIHTTATETPLPDQQRFERNEVVLSPVLSMRCHIGQAFDYLLNPVSGCKICRVVRGYPEVITNGHNAYGKSSGAVNCAEYATAPRCKNMEVHVIGPTDPSGICTVSTLRRFLTQFRHSINWSLKTGKGYGQRHEWKGPREVTWQG